MTNVNRPNAMEWEFQEILKATALIKGAGDMLVSDALGLLLDPHKDVPDFTLTGDRLVEWKDQVKEIEEGERAKFLQVLQIFVDTAKNMMTGIETVIVDTEHAFNPPLPDPDTVVIPDSVAGIENPSWNNEGDCVAVDFERCPACGDVPDHCQGHGEIGDPDGHSILDHHDDGDHTFCVKVRDMSKEVDN